MRGDTACPKCGNPVISIYNNGTRKCDVCGYIHHDAIKLVDNNPYTDFAKEMSLLHEALKAEGFKDSMVDILSKMAPIVWDKVTNERARKNMGEAIKQSLKAKEDIDKEKWKKFERGCY